MPRAQVAKNLIEDHSNRVLVRLWRGVLDSHIQFGCDIAVGAKDISGFRDSGMRGLVGMYFGAITEGIWQSWLVVSEIPVENACQAKVTKFDVPLLIEKDILWLDVPVDDARLMERRQSPTDLNHLLDCEAKVFIATSGARMLAEPSQEIAARQILRHHVLAMVVSRDGDNARVKHLHNMKVAISCSSCHFLSEAFDCVFVIQSFGSEDLDCDGGVELR